VAFQPVQIVEAQPETRTTGRKKGWGKEGALVGGAVGAVAGAMAGTGAGGPGAGTVVGAMGGMAAGASAGQMLGEKLRPSSEGKTAIDRRVASQGPAVQNDASEKLKQSIVALQSAPPDVRAQYAKPLVDAYMTTVAQKYT
jgi:outer membrane lipoprotein SlyB